jgi:hypothetical protein
VARNPLSALKDKLLGRSRRTGTLRRTPSSFRPHLETLDAREVPAAVTYNFGHLLSNVEVTAEFDGAAWSSNTTYQAEAGQLTNFLNQIVDSPYVDQLGEYSAGGQTIGRGSYSGTDSVNATTRSEVFGGNSYTTTDDSDIRSMLNYEITLGRVPAPDGNRLYVVYVQPNTVVNALAVPGVYEVSNGANAPGPGAKAFSGYHSSATDNAGNTYYYAVVVDPSGYAPTSPLGIPGGLSNLQYATITSSHEIAEAITDPAANGWSGSGGEIGDITQSNVPPGGAITTEDGFTVQKEWSDWLNTSTAAPSNAVRYVMGNYNGTDAAFVLTTGGTVERFDPASGGWGAITGTNTNASQLVSAGGIVYMVAANQGGTAQVWSYTGSGSNWQQITNSPYVGRIVTVGGQIYIRASNGGNWEAYQYNGYGTSWAQMTGSNTNVTDIASDGINVYIVASNGGGNEVYQYNGYGTSWTQLTGSTNVLQIATAGGQLYCLAENAWVSTGYQVFDYSGSGTNWTQLTGSTNVSQIAAAGGELYCLAENAWVSPTYQVFKYNTWANSWTQLTYASTSVQAIAAAGDGLYAEFNTGGSGFANAQVRKFGGGGPSDWTNITGANTAFPGSLKPYGDQLQVELLTGSGTYVIEQYQDSPMYWGIPVAT